MAPRGRTLHSRLCSASSRGRASRSTEGSSSSLVRTAIVDLSRGSRRGHTSPPLLVLETRTRAPSRRQEGSWQRPSPWSAMSSCWSVSVSSSWSSAQSRLLPISPPAPLPSTPVEQVPSGSAKRDYLWPRAVVGVEPHDQHDELDRRERDVEDGRERRERPGGDRTPQSGRPLDRVRDVQTCVGAL